MFSRLNLLTKIVIVLLPLFLLAVGTSVYLTHHYQEHQALEQMQSAATAQATILKESLVHMMVTTQKVDESYLNRISQTRDIENISVWFYTDSLHLDDELLSSSRLERLRDRELKLPREKEPMVRQVLSTGESLWLVQCEIGKHTEGLVEVLSSGRPLLLRSCEKLKVILPFAADQRCQTCHNVDEGAVLGAAYMEMPLDKTVRALASNAERTIWIFGIFTVVALGIGGFIFRAFVSKPVKRLIRAAHDIGDGTLDQPVASNFAADELGDIAKSFDSMQQRLKESQEKLLREERLSAVGKMASTIVHDLRSPLGAVLLGLDTFRENGNREQTILNTLKSSILRINRMAQELLDFSRGDIRLAPKQTDVVGFVDSLSNEIVPSLNQTGIQFVRKLEYQGSVLIDPDRLHRALLNIINNAADALRKGGEITLTVLQHGEDVLFTISDNGPGIPAEIKTTLFDPFVTAGKAKGTGLGLSITKEIVERHGGSISFESADAKGTTFFVNIPMSKEKEKSLNKMSTENPVLYRKENAV